MCRTRVSSLSCVPAATQEQGRQNRDHLHLCAPQPPLTTMIDGRKKLLMCTQGYHAPSINKNPPTQHTSRITLASGGGGLKRHHTSNCPLLWLTAASPHATHNSSTTLMHSHLFICTRGEQDAPPVEPLPTMQPSKLHMHTNTPHAHTPNHCTLQLSALYTHTQAQTYQMS